MFLCLYSGGSRRKNEAIDLRVVERIGKRGTLAYIPSDSTHPASGAFFAKFKRYYKHYGVQRFKYFCPDQPFRLPDARRALEADGVYLSGGNTFYFRHWLRHSKFDRMLLRYAARGGSLLGQSAGSVIMTPEITSASIGPVKDENGIRLLDMAGLNLIDTLFVPHYEPRKEIVAEIRRFSSRNKSRLVVAAQDGGGIIKCDGVVSLVGPIALFAGGQALQGSSV